MAFDFPSCRWNGWLVDESFSEGWFNHPPVIDVHMISYKIIVVQKIGVAINDGQ